MTDWQPAPTIPKQQRQPRQSSRIRRLLSYFERLKALQDVTVSRGLKAQRERRAKAHPAKSRKSKAKRSKH